MLLAVFAAVIGHLFNTKPEPIAPTHPLLMPSPARSHTNTRPLRYGCSTSHTRMPALSICRGTPLQKMHDTGDRGNRRMRRPSFRHRAKDPTTTEREKGDGDKKAKQQQEASRTKACRADQIHSHPDSAPAQQFLTSTGTGSFKGRGFPCVSSGKIVGRQVPGLVCMQPSAHERAHESGSSLLNPLSCRSKRWLPRRQARGQASVLPKYAPKVLTLVRGLRQHVSVHLWPSEWVFKGDRRGLSRSIVVWPWV